MVKHSIVSTEKQHSSTGSERPMLAVQRRSAHTDKLFGLSVAADASNMKAWLRSSQHMHAKDRAVTASESAKTTSVTDMHCTVLYVRNRKSSVDNSSHTSTSRQHRSDPHTDASRILYWHSHVVYLVEPTKDEILAEASRAATTSVHTNGMRDERFFGCALADAKAFLRNLIERILHRGCSIPRRHRKCSNT